MQREIMCVKKDFLSEDVLRAYYYGCTVEAAEPQVTRIFAKLLPEGKIAVFGSFEILFLFTYRIRGGNTGHFSQKLERAFSDIFPDKIEEEGYGLNDLELKPGFDPHVTCSPLKKAGYQWNIAVSGTLTVTLCTAEGVSPREEPYFKAYKNQNIPENSYYEDEKQATVANTSSGIVRRINRASGIDTDALLNMNPKDRESYMHNDYDPAVMLKQPEPFEMMHND